MTFNHKILLPLLLLQLITIQCLWSQKELWMSSTDANIQKRAAKQAAPGFQIPVGASHVDIMELIGPGKLLVGLSKDAPGVPNSEYLLIDTNKGKVVWRYLCEKGKYKTYLIFRDLLLLKVEKRKTIDFLAINTIDGTEKWKRSFKGAAAFFEPVLSNDLIWRIHPLSKKQQVTAFSIQNGQTLWEAEWDFPFTNTPTPVINNDKVYTFHNGLEALNSNTGDPVYKIPYIKLNEQSPEILFDKSLMYMISDDNKLWAIDHRSGVVGWQTKLADTISFTNISLLGNTLYLRGETTDGEHHLLSVSVTDGREQWNYQDKEALLSNLIVYNGKLFYGTASSIKAVNSANGNLMFTSKVTETGRNYPVTIREIDGNIVFIHELVVAAYNANTGILKYKHGITPLGPDLHLNGLDAALPNLKKELAAVTGKSSPGMANMFSNQARYYQNMANSHYSKYQNYRSSGDYMSSSNSYRKYKQSNEQAKTTSFLAMTASIMELGTVLGNSIKAAAIKAEINEQELFRQSILEVYSRAENEKYVYRPSMIYHSTSDQYVGLSMIHLPTGKIRKTYLSPIYLSYGFWNLVDFENQMVIHHGIGMDPSLYTLSEPRRYPIKKQKTVETFIIGLPLEFVE